MERVFPFSRLGGNASRFPSPLKHSDIVYLHGSLICAHLAGINEGRIRLTIYALSGLVSGIAGLVLVSRTTSGAPTAGTGWELDTIAAIVIGGTRLFGGEGSLLKAMAGVLIYQIIANFMNLAGLDPFYQSIVRALLIILRSGCDRAALCVYTISGAFAAAAGFLFLARTAFVAPNSGENLLLTAIASVVVGGVSLSGGKGSIRNAFFGVLLLASLSNLMNILLISPHIQDAVSGVIILVAITVSKRIDPERD